MDLEEEELVMVQGGERRESAGEDGLVCGERWGKRCEREDGRGEQKQGGWGGWVRVGSW